MTIANADSFLLSSHPPPMEAEAPEALPYLRGPKGHINTYRERHRLRLHISIDVVTNKWILLFMM